MLLYRQLFIIQLFYASENSGKIHLSYIKSHQSEMLEDILSNFLVT